MNLRKASKLPESRRYQDESRSPEDPTRSVVVEKLGALRLAGQQVSPQQQRLPIPLSKQLQDFYLKDVVSRPPVVNAGSKTRNNRTQVEEKVIGQSKYAIPSRTRDKGLPPILPKLTEQVRNPASIRLDPIQAPDIQLNQAYEIGRNNLSVQFPKGALSSMATSYL